MRRNKYVPLWVDIVYKFAEKWDRVFSDISTMTFWRFGFMDKYCRCPRCIEREKAGLQ